MINSPAQSRMLSALAPKRHVQGPRLPEGPAVNDNTGGNVIDFTGRSPEPFNWMNWPKGLPTGQENNPNGFDFGLHPQPANQPTSPNAPVEPIYQDPFTETAPKFPEGFDPMPGSNQGVRPFDMPGQFGPNDPMIAPMQGTPNWGVIGMLPAIMSGIGQEMAPMDQSGWGSGVPDIPWNGTNGAETPSFDVPMGPMDPMQGSDWYGQNGDYQGGGGGGGLRWIQQEEN